jgi:hypothetical protein
MMMPRLGNAEAGSLLPRQDVPLVFQSLRRSRPAVLAQSERGKRFVGRRRKSHLGVRSTERAAPCAMGLTAKKGDSTNP